MRSSALLLLVLSGFLASSPVAAQFDDTAVCRWLETNASPGLYIAARSAMPQPVKGSTTYDPAARLYYLVPNGRNGPARVQLETTWHVRTKTVARAAAPADEVLVWRRDGRTLCSPDRDLEAFDTNSRFRSLRAYLDHHKDDSPVQSTALVNGFHFDAHVAEERRQCVRTDDRSAIGSLQPIYGFDDVARQPAPIAKAARISPAVADETVQRYAGLSSELAIVTGPTVACFGFSIPLPTKYEWTLFNWGRQTIALQQAAVWRPQYTYIVIRRMPYGPSRSIRIDWKQHSQHQP